MTRPRLYTRRAKGVISMFLSFLLVVFITTPDGEVNRFVMDSQLSYTDCQLSGRSIEPLDGNAQWVCVPDFINVAEPVGVDYE